MRRRSLLAGSAIVLAAAFVSLPGLAHDAPKRVAAAVMPLTSMIEAIGGAHVEVLLMVPPGVSPATYEPSPQQMAALEDAALYVAMGIPHERNWMPQVRAARPDMPVLRMMDRVQTRTIAGRGDRAGQQVPDPHIWLGAPQLRDMATALRDELTVILPDHAGEISANADAWLARLDAADAAAREALAPHEGRAFLVFHPAFGYMADAYGLRQIAIEEQGMEPGPRMIAAAIDAARAEDIRVIFVQAQFSTTEAETIAAEISGQVVQLNPLHPDPIASIAALAQAFTAAFE